MAGGWTASDLSTTHWTIACCIAQSAAAARVETPILAYLQEAGHKGRPAAAQFAGSYDA